ncbi:MAG: GFA family protein [Betaproteobacteria bacterium]|nr:GFA family protein [Betaproteobacteria bacterium]
MRVDGGCHCGKITYEAEIDPETVSICHCTDCQTLSGSAYRSNVRTLKGTFKLRSGQPKIYVKTAESGNQRAQAFCPDCGSPIYSTTVTDPQIHGLRVGTLRQRGELRPKTQGWCRSAQSWVTDLSSMTRHPKQPSR